MRKIFSSFVCFSESPNFNGYIFDTEVDVTLCSTYVFTYTSPPLTFISILLKATTGTKLLESVGQLFLFVQKLGKFLVAKLQDRLTIFLSLTFSMS